MKNPMWLFTIITSALALLLPKRKAITSKLSSFDPFEPFKHNPQPVTPQPSAPSPVTPVTPRTGVDPRRFAVVNAAANELGVQDPSKYWNVVLPAGTVGMPKHWCGGFSLWALKQAGLAQGIDWIVGKGFAYRLPTTSSPEPGDIAYYTQNQHHAIVESVSADKSTITTIDGNQAGSTVTRRTRPYSDAAAFYSIKPLLSEALS